MKEDKLTDKTASLHAFRARSQEDALERINRITGLKFDSLPESLVTELEGKILAQDDGEELVHRALSLWATQHPEGK